MQFSDSTNRTGIVELLGDLTTTQAATTSSYPIASKTRDINNALGNFFIMATQAAGRWQVDDTNQIDYPIITTDIVNGQQDYIMLTDESGNQILDIYKVRCKDSSGIWHTLTQRDIQDGNDDPINSSNTTSSPTKYDLQSNGIFLTDIPNYNSTNGLELYVTRTPSYFLSTDTTKKPGIPDVFHEYLAFRPAYFYCLAKGLPQADRYREILYGADLRHGMEGAIKAYYSNRNRDEKRRLVANVENNK